MERRVLVTGGSRGIGRAIVLSLARDGFTVVVNYRTNEDQAAAVCAEVQAAGGSAQPLGFDVSDREASRQAVLADMEANGTYYGVVLNAGVTADAPLPGLSGEDWDRVLRTNLDGFFNVLHPVVMPMVRAKKGGRIVTMSSLSGISGNRGQTNYAASKGGLIAATKSLARELAKRNITVNSVAPGLIETDMIEEAPVAEILKAIPMRRLGKPEEVASLVSYLFSDLAGYITGEVISMSGGIL